MNPFIKPLVDESIHQTVGWWMNPFIKLSVGG
jgi:hypothetical protein